MKALILTALPVEYLSVREHLTEPIVEFTDESGAIYEIGTFDGVKESWEVWILETDMGNANSAAETQRALSLIKPDIATFVGVAGGIKDVALGDVVCASKVYGYEHGKDADEFKPRTEYGQPGYAALHRARAVLRADLWQNRIKGQVPNDRPKAFFKPIVTGEKVVASTDSPTYKRIISDFSDALAVEMEALGFHVAARAHPRVSSIVVRGISDLIDNKQVSDSGGWQEVASKHAAAFAYEVLNSWTTPDGTPEAENNRVSNRTWNIPIRRNSNFVGRKELIDLFKQLMEESEKSEIPEVAVLFGMNGVGKTQAAVEFAYSVSDEIDIVWMQDAHDQISLISGLSDLLSHASVDPAVVMNEEKTIRLARDYFEANSRKWLLVLDGASPGPEVLETLPRRGKGLVLITSVSAHWPASIHRIELGPLEDDESIEFLTTRLRIHDNEVLLRLATSVGHLPLALEQSAGFIEATNTSPARFIDMLSEHPSRVLAQEGPYDHPQSAMAALSLSFESISLTPVAGSLLGMLSLLSSAPVPWELMRFCAEVSPETSPNLFEDELKLAEALRVLRAHSLIYFSGEYLIIHQLVQQAMKDWMSDQVSIASTIDAIKVANICLPAYSFDVENWWVCELILPHAVEVAKLTGAPIEARPHLGRMLNHLGQYLRARGRFSEAMPFLSRAVDIARTEFGDVSQNSFAVISNLAEVAASVGDLDVARSLRLEAIEIQRQLSGEQSVEYAVSLEGYAHVSIDLGEFERAEELLRRSKAILLSVGDAPEEDVARVHNDLGDVLRELGQLTEAETELKTALGMYMSLRGSDDQEIAMVLTNLANIRASTADHLAAKELNDRALGILITLLGEDHPSTCIVESNLAANELELGQTVSARKHANHALKVNIDCYGPTHPSLVRDYSLCGSIDFRIGDALAAKISFEHAIEIGILRGAGTERFLEKPHNELALILEDLGQFDLAMDHFKSAVRIAKSFRPRDGSTRAIYLNNLGTLYVRRNDFLNARKSFQLALDIARIHSKPNDLSMILSGLAGAYYHLGNVERASRLFRESLSVAAKGPITDPHVLNGLKSNARLALDDAEISSLF